jgi:hypothetical protein
LIEGRLAYVDYLQDNASDEFRPDLHGNLLWRLDPDRWTWSLDGALRQVRISELGPDAPENRETQGSISTGPEFRAPFSAASSFVGDVKVGYLYNSDTNDDNVSLDAHLAINTETGDTAVWSGNLHARTVSYIEDAESPGVEEFSDFSIAEAFVGYSRQDARILTSAEVGGSFADIQDAGSVSDIFLRLDIARLLSENSKAGLRAFYGYDDEGRTSLIRSLVPEVGGPTEARAPELFYDKRGELYYTRTTLRSSFSGRLYARDRDFVDVLRDERTYGVGFSLTRRVTRPTRAELFGYYEFGEFEGTVGDRQDYRLGMRLVHRFSRFLSGMLEVRHQQRTSDDEAAEYEENAVFLSLSRRLPL